MTKKFREFIFLSYLGIHLGFMVVILIPFAIIGIDLKYFSLDIKNNTVTTLISLYMLTIVLEIIFYALLFHERELGFEDDKKHMKGLRSKIIYEANNFSERLRKLKKG